MNHEPACNDPVVVVQPQLGRGLPVVATCRTCGAIEVRKPSRHVVGEVCKWALVDHCCEPDTIPRLWKQRTPRSSGSRPRPTTSTPTTTTSEDPDATPI